MGDDLTSLIIYLALAVLGIIASAVKNKNKRQQQNHPNTGGVPRSFPADPQKDYGPELGPLIELFDIPKPRKLPDEYETVEDGPSVEEEGMMTESRKASEELSGYQLDRPVSEVEKPVEEIQSFEEGQSDIQKMIARYDAIRKELQYDGGLGDDIASGEIVSVEAEEEARIKKQGEKQKFDARKAIIYSEILKRREY
jgi:hypothetical protein